jgi:hypothetical protein
MRLNETYSTVHIGKHLFDTFPIQKQVGVKLNGIHQLLVYADDVNLLGDNTDTIKENIQTLIETSKEVDLKVNTEKSMYMLLTEPVKLSHSSNIWERQ